MPRVPTADPGVDPKDSDVRGIANGFVNALKRPNLSPPARWLASSLGVVIIAAGVLALLTSLSQHAIVNNSDTSTVVLEGSAMLHGNVLLHNWSLSLDSFWTVDVPFYALGTLLVGLRPLLVNLIPALIGLLTVIVGVRVACDGLRGRAALVATATVVALLLLPGHTLAFFFLQGPWHIATGLWCLIAFLGIRTGRFGWGWIATVIFLAAGLLGDVQALAFGVLPVFVAGLIAIARRRAWRSGVAPISAAIASIALAEAVREIALKLGTFTFSESHHTATAARMSHSVGHLVDWGAALFGVIAGPYGGPSIPFPLELAHLIGLIAVLACVSIAGYRLARGVMFGERTVNGDDSWRLDDLLLLGLIGDLGVFEVLTLSNNILYARYLTVAVIFAIILTARTLGRAVHLLLSGPMARFALGLGLLVVAAFSAEVGLELADGVPAQPATALDAFLVAHHLHSGIGDYWAASAVTVQSEGSIEVRPVVANLKHQIVPDGRQAPITWYSGQRFQFLVYQSLPYGRVEATTVAGTFGAPEKTWTVGQYRVAVWSHPITLSGPAFP